MAALKWLAILVGLLLILGGGLLGFLLVVALASCGKREPPADGRSVEKEEEPS